MSFLWPTGQAIFVCDNFCTSKNVVVCTCEEAGNPLGKTVWKLSNTTTSCIITLNQTGVCNATSGNCAAFPGIIAANDPVMMDGASCLSSTLSIPKSNSLEGLQINCMSPNGISYGGIGFSTGRLLIPACLYVCNFICLVSLKNNYHHHSNFSDGGKNRPNGDSLTKSGRVNCPHE